jgi:NAD(P)-dependent dehydrogenase (short-subunit alcohol dehydrogenase family)
MSAAIVTGAGGAIGSASRFFNNAGIEGLVAPIIDYPVEEFDRVIATNLRGIFHGLKYVLPVVEDNGRSSTPGQRRPSETARFGGDCPRTGRRAGRF